MQKIQVKLQVPQETLQISYPPEFPVLQKTGQRSDQEFHLSTTPRFLSGEEIDVAEEFITNLPYRQELIRTGLILLDANDPLLLKTHDELDQVEAQANLSSTRNAPAGGMRAIRERVILIRERFYQGTGNLALPAAAVDDTEGTSDDASAAVDDTEGTSDDASAGDAPGAEDTGDDV